MQYEGIVGCARNLNERIGRIFKRFGGVVRLYVEVIIEETAYRSARNIPASVIAALLFGKRACGKRLVNRAIFCRTRFGINLRKYDSCAVILGICIKAAFVVIFHLFVSAVAVGNINIGILYEIISFVFGRGVEGDLGSGIVFVGCTRAVPTVCPEIISVCGLEFAVCRRHNRRNVKLVYFRAQAYLEHKSYRFCILYLKLYIRRVFYAVAFKSNAVGYHRNERGGNLPNNRLVSASDIGMHLHRHIHHIAVLNIALRLTEKAIGTVDIYRVFGMLCHSLVPEGMITAVRLCIPAYIVAVVIFVFVVKLLVLPRLRRKKLCFRNVGNAHARSYRTYKFVAQIGRVIHGAQAVTVAVDLRSEHRAVEQGFSEQNALNILDLHIFADPVLEGDIAAEVGIVALEVGGVIARLYDDLINDFVKAVDHFSAVFGGIVFVDVVRKRAI